MAMHVHWDGWLIAEQWSGKKKKIRCRPHQLPQYSDPVGLGLPFALEWQADKPYWLDYDETILPIGQIIPLWRFPFTPPVQFGYAVAEVNIANDTSIEIPLRIEVLSQATNITVINESTGRRFEVAELIEENEKMVIDGENCNIEIVNLLTGARNNATNKLVSGSQFITLVPGENRITLNNGIADATPLSYIIYNNHSLAV